MGLPHASVNYVDSQTRHLTSVQDELSGRLDGVNQTLAAKADLVNGKVPSAQLPGFVDDVIEYADVGAFPEVGENGKLYLAADVNKVYRWSGTQYVEISGSLALGETSATAFPGDRGKAAETAVANEIARAQTAEQGLGTRIDGLVSGKAAAVHTHPVADITGLQDAIDTAADQVEAALRGDVAGIREAAEKVVAASKVIEDAAEDVAEAKDAAVEAKDAAEEAAEAAETAAGNAATSASNTEAIKTELQDALDTAEALVPRVDDLEDVALGKLRVLNVMPIRNYIYSYFGKDSYLTFAGWTQLSNGDFLVASAKYAGGSNGKLLVFFQFTQACELVHKIEITLTDGVYGNYTGHFVVVDGVLNHIIRGIRREFTLDSEDKIALGNTYTIDGSALGVTPWDRAAVEECGETQAFALGNYIVYEKFVVNKTTNAVESVLTNRITSVTEPSVAITNFVWFVVNRKTAYKASVDAEGAISFTGGATYAPSGYPAYSARFAYSGETTDAGLLASLCGTPNFTTGDTRFYSLLWGFGYGTSGKVSIFSPNIFTDERVIAARNFTACKNDLLLFDTTDKMIHLLKDRSPDYLIAEYRLGAHLQAKIGQPIAKIVASDSKGVLVVSGSIGFVSSPDIFRGFQDITHAYYIPWTQE